MSRKSKYLFVSFLLWVMGSLYAFKADANFFDWWLAIMSIILGVVALKLLIKWLDY